MGGGGDSKRPKKGVTYYLNGHKMISGLLRFMQLQHSVRIAIGYQKRYLVIDNDSNKYYSNFSGY